jgi:DNA-binding IclR family transcriptional regulator
MPKTAARSGIRTGRAAAETLPSVKSVSRAVRVLTCLGDGLNTLTGIAARCRLTKSTVHRLLRALEDAGLAAEHRPDHRYYLGPLMARLVTNPRAIHTDLVACALDRMRRLSRLFGEMVNLCVMPGLQSISVYEIGGTYDLTVAPDLARIGTPYAGSFYRMLFAQLGEARLRSAIKHLFTHERQAFGQTSREEFLHKIREARRQGYTVSIEEKLPGVIGIAAPVSGYTCPAALGVVGPEYRMRSLTGEVVREVLAGVREVSDNVHRAITGSGPAPAMNTEVWENGK